MANVLHADAAISCPHGGTASLQSMQTRVAASGQIVADLSGQWVITGCSFTVGGRPQPCVTVHWTTTATRVSVLGHNIVTQGSTGSASISKELAREYRSSRVCSSGSRLFDFT